MKKAIFINKLTSICCLLEQFIWRALIIVRKSFQEHFSNLQILKEAQMIESNLFEDCESFIKRDLEDWKSYFLKWEVIAKHEEFITESELLNKPFNRVKSGKKKKVKRLSSMKKLKSLYSLTFQKNLKHRKKHVKKVHNCASNNTKSMIIKKCGNFKPDYKVSDLVNDQMEMILKSVFTYFLKANINNLEVFGVLSQMYSKRERTDSNQLFSHCQQTLSCNELQSNERNCLIMNQYISSAALSSMNICNMSVCAANDIQSLNLNFSDYYAQPVLDNNKLNRAEFIPVGTFSNFEFSCKNNKNYLQLLMSPPNNVMPPRTIQTNFDIKAYHSSLFDDPQYENTKLKPFELDLSQNSQTNLFRKINKEYFNKKVHFPEMNIIQDEKRFKNLWLHERTNNVSLSMENSNFATPERKPPERKCFSENVLQRKRGHPSKLFFDNEEDDSESDDQTQKQAPLIYSKNKIKSQVTYKVVDDESDSDDCESIFDRIKKT